MRLASVLLASSMLFAPPVASARPAPAPARDAAAAGDPMRGFAAGIVIPHQQFRLANGLTVIVHTDRSVPMVAVSMWYDVGSKHEPAGRSGFAHLFEHLMFNGSENVPGDFFKPLQAAGAVDLNGTTSNDRTNYYATVPTAALDRALFMESDRMGHLLGAVGQAVLDEQRGVVQNEKRQGDDSPYAVIDDKVRAALYPADHPYGHSVIGSMADLDAADLSDVRGWFRNHYAPNNALLVLAGDIDAATARPLVEKYFGDIARGPANVRPLAPIPTLPRRVDDRATAPVTAPVIVRAWAVPGYDDADALGLDVVAGVMAQIDQALFDRVLVRDRKLFERVRTSNNTLAQGGTFTIQGRVADGVDAAVAARALDEVIARFLREGPSADEVQRWTTGFTVGYARRLEGLTPRAEALAQGVIFNGRSDSYRRDLDYFASRDPASVLAVARTWLGRPAYALTVLPGARIVETTVAKSAALTAPANTPAEASPPRVARMAMPGIGDPVAPRFPQVTRARLSNGIGIVYARKAAVPFTQVSMTFDGGSIVDPDDRPGLQSLMFSAMGKGVPGHDSRWIEARKERVGLSLGVDNGSAWLSAPTVHLAPALSLLGQRDHNRRR